MYPLHKFLACYLEVATYAYYKLKSCPCEMLNDKIIKSHIKSVVDQVNIPLIVSLKFVNIFENWQFVIF